MENKSNKSAIVGIVLVILIVLLGAWWLSRQVFLGPNPAALGDLGEGVATSTALSGVGASVSISDQVPGPSVFIADVVLPQGGWVVIRSGAGATAGPILGAGYFDAETHVGEIFLSRPTVAGEKLSGILYGDNGDSNFNLAGDAPLLDEANQLVSASFMISGLPPENKG